MALIRITVAQMANAAAAIIGKRSITVLIRWLIDHEFAVHWYLLSASILAALTVGAGILWEGDGPLSIKKVAHACVLWGIVIEAVASVLLFAFDDKIAESQNDKIIALVSAIGQRQLNSEQVSKIVSELKGKVITPIAVIRTRDPEAGRYAIDIAADLSSAGLPFTVLDMDEETKFLGFSDSPMFMYSTDENLVNLVVAAFRGAAIPIWGSTERFPILPSQPSNSIYVSLRAAPLVDIPVWAIPPDKK
jgi:hypothetical protein